MNSKRLILAIVVAFIFIFASDYLIHGIWLAPDYKATAQLWRPEAEMHTHFVWMVIAQLLCATTFVLIWASGFASRGSVGLACAFGLVMGLFVQVSTIVTFVVTPMPPELAFKWFLSGVAQAIVLGVVTFFAYKPAPANMSA